MIGVDVIVAADLANNSITVAELSNNAVTSDTILDNAVIGAKIAMGSDAVGVRKRSSWHSPLAVLNPVGRLCQYTAPALPPMLLVVIKRHSAGCCQQVFGLASS